MNISGKQGVINGETKVLGIIGEPVEHSLSPAMHNAAFKEEGLNFCYLPFRVSSEDLPAAVSAVRALGLRGLNVTSPHKEAVVPYLDELTPEASFLQAVNTIQNQNGKLIGHNTDVEGFLFLLANNNLIKNQNIYPGGKICLLGAGGAARAACLALSRAGAEHIVIYNRTPARAEALASLLVKGGLFKEKAVDVVKWGKNALRESLTRVDMIINALSVDPVELGLLPERTGKPVCKAAIDLRYGSLPRSFIKWADDNGMLFFDGLDMLLGQGLKAFEILTGEKAPLQTMRKALLQAVV